MGIAVSPTPSLPLEGKADDTRIESAHKAFGHRHYLYFAALRSFDSVLPFQISHFLTYDVFLRSG